MATGRVTIKIDVIPGMYMDDVVEEIHNFVHTMRANGRQSITNLSSDFDVPIYDEYNSEIGTCTFQVSD